MNLARPILSHPERALRPRQTRIAPVRRGGDGGDDPAGTRVHFLDTIIRDLPQMLSVEGRARVRGDREFAAERPALRIQRDEAFTAGEPGTSRGRRT